MNDVYQFDFDGSRIKWTLLYANNPVDNDAPAPRSSHCSGYSNNAMYIFGGEDEDHAKLKDFWSFSIET